MIGMIIPSAFAETYVFKNLQDVSIDIPSSFEIWNDGFDSTGYVVWSGHSKDGTLFIAQYSIVPPGDTGHWDFSDYTDDEFEEYELVEIKRICENKSFENSGYTCTQHEIIDTIVHTVDGYRAISFVQEYVRTTEHG